MVETGKIIWIINREITKGSKKEILELKITIADMKKSPEESAANLSRNKKKSAKLNIR